ARLLVRGLDQDVDVVGGDAHAQEHALVFLLIDEDVLAAADRAAIDAGRAGVVVAPDPEQPARIRRDAEAARGALGPIRQALAAGEVADDDLVVFRALLIHGPGVETVVRGVMGPADGVVGLSL